MAEGVANCHACAHVSLLMQALVWHDDAQIVDFDGQSLRRSLPRIVKTLQGALSAGGRVYVHCTAGLGRAPAVCIAWRYWFGGLQLDEVRGFSTLHGTALVGLRVLPPTPLFTRALHPRAVLAIASM